MSGKVKRYWFDVQRNEVDPEEKGSRGYILVTDHDVEVKRLISLARELAERLSEAKLFVIYDDDGEERQSEKSINLYKEIDKTLSKAREEGVIDYE